MNVPTLPPWLSPWAGGLVYGQRVYKGAGGGGERGARERLRPRLTIYTLGHEHSAPILSWSESASASPLGAGGAMRWERVPLDHAPWHVDVPVPVQPDINERPPPLLERAADDFAEGGGSWGGVMRGWAAGAALLALLVVIARLAEHFLDWKYLMRAEEGFVVPGETDSTGGAELGPCSVDLPPPYSELSPPAPPKVEEPPPPYAEGDSCVQFMNKDGIPVLVFNRALDPAGRRRVTRILRAAGIDLAPAPHQSAPDSDSASVVNIITDDDELDTCVVGEASAPKDADVEERGSNEDTVDSAASATATTVNTVDDDDQVPKDGSVAV